MVRLIADKTSSSGPAELLLNFRDDHGSWNLEWQGGERHTYFVQQSENLAEWSCLPAIKTGAASQLILAVKPDAADSRAFFRLAATDQQLANPYTGDFDRDGASNWTEVSLGGDPLRGE